MPLEKNEVRGILITKFKFVEVGGSKHDAVSLYYRGTKVATTRFSRSYSEISDAILGRMAKQLGVNLGTFKKMSGCTVDLETYLKTLYQRHPERFEPADSS